MNNPKDEPLLAYVRRSERGDELIELNVDQFADLVINSFKLRESQTKDSKN